MGQSGEVKLLGLAEVAERLGLGLSTVRRWASERRIPTVKLGGRVLVAERDLARLIADRTRPARSEVAV